MNQQQRQQRSDYELEERATEARMLLQNPILRECLDSVYARYLQTLQNADINSLTAASSHAMLKAIAQLKNELEAIITDHNVRMKRGG